MLTCLVLLAALSADENPQYVDRDRDWDRNTAKPTMGRWLNKLLPFSRGSTEEEPRVPARRSTAAPSDGLLANRCRAILGQDPLLAREKIFVRSEAGTIVLQGVVPSPEVADRAYQQALKTTGIRGVRSELSVTGPSLPPMDWDRIALGEPRAAMPVRPAGSGQADAMHDVVPAAPLSRDRQAVRRSEPGWGDGPLPYRPIQPIPATAPVAQLGNLHDGSHHATLHDEAIRSKPQVIPARPGLPSVLTYVVPRPNPMGEGGSFSATPTVARVSIPVSEAHQVETAAASPFGRRVIPTPQHFVPLSPSAIQSVEPTAAESTIESRSLNEELEELFANTPEAHGLKFQLQGTDVVLHGEVESSASLFEVIRRTKNLSRVGQVTCDTHRLIVRR